jgi:hypothetical protein
VRWTSQSDEEKAEWERKAEEYEAMNEEVIELTLRRGAQLSKKRKKNILEA